MSSHNDSYVASGTSPTTKSVSSPPSDPVCDLIFENHGSLYLIRPTSPAGQTWLDENVGDEETLTSVGAAVCEPRYVENIFLVASAAGLVVSL